MYSRALKPGDYVRVGDIEGVVAALGMLSTKIRTSRREVVTLPNAVVAGASVMNYSRAQPELILQTGVMIGYATPWRQVEALLLMAAGRTDGIRTAPAAHVMKAALSDFTIDYQLRAALDRPEERLPVLDRLHGHIIDCFNEYGVQIMSPHYEGDPPTPAIVPRDRWRAAPASAAETPPDRPPTDAMGGG
jgi:small-conductance mechanosensitive channel